MGIPQPLEGTWSQHQPAEHEACLPRILLARCSFEVMIWSMSVRMTASMAGWASCSLDSTASKRALACSYTMRYTASKIWRQRCDVSARLAGPGSCGLRSHSPAWPAHLQPLPLPFLRLPLQPGGELCLQLRAQLLHHQVAQDLGPGGIRRGRGQNKLRWQVPLHTLASPHILRAWPRLHDSTAVPPGHDSRRSRLICLSALQDPQAQGSLLSASAQVGSLSGIPQPPPPCLRMKCVFVKGLILLLDESPRGQGCILPVHSSTLAPD